MVRRPGYRVGFPPWSYDCVKETQSSVPSEGGSQGRAARAVRNVADRSNRLQAFVAGSWRSICGSGEKRACRLASHGKTIRQMCPLAGSDVLEVY